MFKAAKQLNSTAQARADSFEGRKRGLACKILDFFSKIGLKGYFTRKAKKKILEREEFKVFESVIDLKSTDEVEKLAQRVYTQQLKEGKLS